MTDNRKSSKPDRKFFLLIGGAFLFLTLLLAAAVFKFRKGGSVEQKVNVGSEGSYLVKLPDDLEVDILPLPGNKINLAIKNIPSGTQTIEYELTYETEDKGLQGVIGTLDDFSGKEYQKEIFLGTCSSGNCVEHKVSGAISLLLRFSGDYGEGVIEKEFGVELK